MTENAPTVIPETAPGSYTETALRRFDMVIKQHLGNAVADLLEQEGMGGVVVFPMPRYVDWMANNAVVSIRAQLWGRDLSPIEWRVPADWWQAFKVRFFPAWALRRWPARERVFRADVAALYPASKFDLGPHRRASIVVTEARERPQ